MDSTYSGSCTAFDGHRLLARGAGIDVALALKQAFSAGAPGPLLAFGDATGGVIDFDLSGSDTDVAARRDAQLDLIAELLASHLDVDAVLGLLDGPPPRRPQIASALRP